MPVVWTDGEVENVGHISRNQGELSLELELCATFGMTCKTINLVYIFMKI